jgi:hypothetical protein
VYAIALGHGGKFPHGDEKGGMRESGSHGGQDARAPHSRAKTGERGRLARFVGLDTSDLSINVLSSATWFHTKLQPNHRDTKKMTEILTRQIGVLTAY